MHEHGVRMKVLSCLSCLKAWMWRHLCPQAPACCPVPRAVLHRYHLPRLMMWPQLPRCCMSCIHKYREHQQHLPSTVCCYGTGHRAEQFCSMAGACTPRQLAYGFEQHSLINCTTPCGCICTALSPTSCNQQRSQSLTHCNQHFESPMGCPGLPNCLHEP